MLKSLSDLHPIVEKRYVKRRLVLAVAQDHNSLGAVLKAAGKGIVIPVLVGDKNKIKQESDENGFDLSGIEIMHEPNDKMAVEKSIRLINEGAADILMKGNIKTPDLLKGVLNKEWGLRTGKLLNHLALFQVETYHKLLAVTDVAMNIAPNLQDKISIINNSVTVLHKLGVEMPKIAVLGAIEIVDEKMSATLDAALLSKMNQREQISGCIIDGPLAFDNAISAQSAKYKKIKSEVAGDCDLLLVPDIEVGNILYKSLVFLSNAEVASMIVGAKAPIVLTSRSDSEKSKFNSILLAAAVAD